MENMENIPYIFTIFFLTLGPLKVIPVFDRLTHDDTAADRLRVAGLATLISTIIVLGGQFHRAGGGVGGRRRNSQPGYCHGFGNRSHCAGALHPCV